MVDPTRQIIMTTTGELFLPSRILPAKKPEASPGVKAGSSSGLSRKKGVGFSFLQLDPMLDRVVLDLSSASSSSERYAVEFGCCDNPACDCQMLEFWLRPLPESRPSGRSIHLRLSIERQKVDGTNPAWAEDGRLAKQLAARLSPEDWLVAQELYRSEKADHSEPLDGLGLDVPFPDDVLADPSLFVQYQEVFPFARFVRFETAGSAWTVSEHYCTNPDCGCEEVVVDIAVAPDNAPGEAMDVVTDEDVTTVVYDYRTGRVKIEKADPPDAPPARQLFRALQEADPDLGSRVERRQRVLRQVHQRARQSALGRTVPRPIRAQAKIGRNEPCPCGSGKKFKRCCGR